MEANNMAAMREAAVTAYDALDKLKSFSLQLGDVGRMREFNHLVCVAKNRLDAALALPRRQCDVGTPEEQSARWWKFCNKHFIQSPAKDNCAKCPIRGTNRHCELAWAQMPYEKGETNGSR